MTEARHAVLPRVAIVVINWNGNDHVIGCLDSVRKLDYPRELLDVLVIDNGSTDDSPARMSRAFPEIEMKINPSNRGCAAAENQGIDYALDMGADYVWLLNNDVVLGADSLRRLVETAEADDSIAVVGPALYSPYDPKKIDSLGYKVSLRTGRFRNLTPGDPALEHTTGDAVDVDVVQGCASLIRTRVLRDVGRYHAAFEAYFEESDFQVRARRKGYRVVTARCASVWHKKAASYDRVILKRAWLLLRNLVIFECRNARKQQLLVFFPYFFLVHLPYFLLRGSLYAIEQKAVRPRKRA